MTASKDDEHFFSLSVPPAEMDRLWAAGWRHFGVLFFRYRTSVHGKKRFHVLPLRVDLPRFTLSRSQKRVRVKNEDTEVVIRRSFIDAEKAALFAKHSLRFRENRPKSLYEFASEFPDSVPCPNLELCIFLGKRLLGVTFLDTGQVATSAVYAIFDPDEAKRSLGILMMLHSIEYSRARGHRYYYSGYAYREPFAYDYKKRFSGLQCLDWTAGWKPYVNEEPPTGGKAKLRS